MNFPVYGTSPANGSIDTSFAQGTGFNKQVLGIEEDGDEYVFWGDSGLNYYSAYDGLSSINSNKVSPIFRVKKDNKLPDANSYVGGNLNAINNVNNPFCVGGGYIYCVGNFTLYGNNVATHLVKLNTTDMSFVLGNTVTGFSSTTSIQIRYANGKIFCGGAFASTFNGGTSTRLNVFNDDLTIDSTLTTFFQPNGTISNVFEQADGKVVISGAFTTIGGTTQNRIVRYNTDRTVDTTFTTNVGTGPSAGALDVRQLSDGKLILGGAFTTFNGTASQRVIILNTDGNIATAVASGFSSGQINCIAVDGSNNIFCAGTFTTYAGTGRQALAKLSSTLTLDTTYNAVINSGNAYYVAIDGSVLYITCDSNKTSNGVAISSIFSTDLVNGTLDDDFQGGLNISVATTTGRKIHIDSSFIYIYGGTNFVSYGNNRGFDGEFTQYVSFLTKDGVMNKNLDKFYRVAGSFNMNLALIEGNDVYVCTSANDGYGLSTSKGVVKFTDKVLDTTFTASITSSVTCAIYDSGLIAVGAFTSPKNRIVKLDSTGATDATFDVGTGFNGQVDWITKLANGNYLVVGNYTTYKGATANRVCVLDNVGTKVGTFVEGTGLSSSPSAKSLQLSNGNYLIYGNMTTWKSVACNRAIILDDTGTQVSWLADNFNGTINKAVEHDGKVYFTGSFTTFGSTTVNRIACIDLSTGLLVDIFGDGLSGTGNNIIIDTEGKLVVVGNFTAYDNTTVGYVVRLFI